MRQPLAGKRDHRQRDCIEVYAGYDNGSTGAAAPVYTAFDLTLQQFKSEQLNAGVHALIEAKETKHERVHTD